MSYLGTICSLVEIENILPLNRIMSIDCEDTGNSFIEMMKLTLIALIETNFWALCSKSVGGDTI